jgi:hypothetical protein
MQQDSASAFSSRAAFFSQTHGERENLLRLVQWLVLALLPREANSANLVIPELRPCWDSPKGSASTLWLSLNDGSALIPMILLLPTTVDDLTAATRAWCEEYAHLPPDGCGSGNPLLAMGDPLLHLGDPCFIWTPLPR